MDPADILRFADVVHRDRGIPKEIVFGAIEQGLLTAARRRFGEDAVIEVRLDRRSGQISCVVNGKQHTMEFGRIAAQTARQVMNQKFREAERDKHLEEFDRRLNSIVTGTIQRIEGGNLIVNMGRVDGIVPRSEQIRNEIFKVGDRIRAFLFEVRPMGQRVRIVLSRSRPEFVAKLFELEVPEIGDGVIQIRRIEREAGYKTKLAVESTDQRVDPIGACVGVRGSRIKNVIEELSHQEKIDILPYEEQPELMIAAALKPAHINTITLNYDTNAADVIVDRDQLSLAIGRRGANVRLASRLSGWEINISGEEVEDEAQAMDATEKDATEIDGASSSSLEDSPLEESARELHDQPGDEPAPETPSTEGSEPSVESSEVRPPSAPPEPPIEEPAAPPT